MVARKSSIYIRNQGFTLVETIAVICFLAILAALLFPAMTSTRRKASDAVCLSNLHQVGVATRLYADDNDGHYPFALNPSSREVSLRFFSFEGLNEKTPNYNVVLIPYVKKIEIFRCPSDVYNSVERLEVNRFDGAFERWGTSYSYNDALVFKYSYDKVNSANSSLISLYSDTGYWHVSDGSRDVSDLVVNVVYADFHVKRVLRRQAFQEETKELNR